MASPDLVTLTAGKLVLELNPSIGGSISAFERVDENGPWSVLRERSSELENVLEAASFPLVPYVNRIRSGRFVFRGREVVLEPNMAGDPSPLHGQGWLHPWDIVEHGSAHAVLHFNHPAGEWPWTYQARQEFSLDERGLSARLSCRNLSDDPMPCGLGQHPYFSCGAATQIDTTVQSAWTIDEHVLPVEQVAATGKFDLRGRSVCGQGLDHGFGGWGGSARLTDPDWSYELELSSPNAHFFQLYSPRNGGIFVAEPVTHANAALNEPEERWVKLGLEVLEPGEVMHLDMRIDVTPG